MLSWQRELGYAEGNTLHDVKQKYRRLMLRYHPDKLAQFDRASTAAAENRVRRATAAMAAAQLFFEERAAAQAPAARTSDQAFSASYGAPAPTTGPPMPWTPLRGGGGVPASTMQFMPRQVVRRQSSTEPPRSYLRRRAMFA